MGVKDKISQKLHDWKKPERQRISRAMNTVQNTAGLPFMKMHGLGNDFVVIDARDGGDPVTPALARALGDRHRGVGFDQLAVIRPGQDTDFTLDFWNSDGSRAGACGNASRCVCDYMMRQLGCDQVTLTTERGQLSALRRADGLVSVNMGAPILEAALIPLAPATDPAHLPLSGDPIAVGMGNPHCVYFVSDAESVDVAGLGSKIEHDPIFPERSNVEFAALIGPDHLRMRVWERGTGITLACGSGTCATAVAASLRGLTGKRVLVDVDGGQLEVEWREDGVWLTGPVAHVFDATLTPDFLAAL